MEKNKLLRHLRYVLLLFFLWFYAMVTGFTPSVIRASAMFTFVVLGKWMNREANIYNLLCSSCFLLFSMNPYILMSAGFQLSFLAVCGIVFVHPLIFKLYEAPNNILHKTWELISISIAAQITTFPLSLFLFHQFPNYFLMGNLLIIPLSTLVMYSGLIFLITDWIPFIGWVTGSATTIGIDWLNLLVDFIGNLPGALTKNCFISFPELIFLYLFLIIFLLWIIFKWRSLMFTWLLVIIMILTFRIGTISRSENLQLLTVYNSPKQTVISILKNRQVILFTDTATDEKGIARTAGEHVLSLLPLTTSTMQIPSNSMLKLHPFQSEEIVILKGWKEDQILHLSPSVIHPKILIMSGDITIQPEKILQVIKPEKVIFDSSCKRGQVTKLRKEFKKSSISTHDVYTQGAFQLQFETSQ
ncbi:MAG TPA: ComEC/Rec2 family competence protein [Bacteroidia bacterium]|nr:ComEC/Rec2 family competence protein [Bacteroidia bacterium]